MAIELGIIREMDTVLRTIPVGLRLKTVWSH